MLRALAHGSAPLRQHPYRMAAAWVAARPHDYSIGISHAREGRASSRRAEVRLNADSHQHHTLHVHAHHSHENRDSFHRADCGFARDCLAPRSRPTRVIFVCVILAGYLLSRSNLCVHGSLYFSPVM